MFPLKMSPFHLAQSILLTHEPLRVLPLPVPVVLVAAVSDDVGHDAEEGQLLVVLRQALALGEVQLPRAVVVQDVAEDVLE